MRMTMFLLGFLMSVASAQSTYDRGSLRPWFYSQYNRGNVYPEYGKDQLMPQKRGSAIRAMICTGAGCPIRLKFDFTLEHKRQVELAMRKVCATNDAKCELAALREGVRALDSLIWSEVIFKTDRSLVKSAFNKGSNGSGEEMQTYQHYTMDCVDQATNGTVYLMVLTDWGLVKHHRVIAPGQDKGMQPHFYTRIQTSDGKFLKFDLYDRSNSTTKRRLPGVRSENYDKHWNR